MKQRRLTIVAFLLIATLVLGIGYAAISGTLAIDGTATYNPNSLLESMTKVYFSHVTTTDCAVSLDAAGENATMTVAFNDLEGTDVGGTSSYTAIADFTVSYAVGMQVNAANLPNATVNATVTPANCEGFTVAGEFASTHNTTVTINPDGTAHFIVTVTYEVPSTIPTTAQNCTINIDLNYEIA